MTDEGASAYANNVVRAEKLFGNGPGGPPLQPPGGGGTFDGMEARVSRLEAHLERAQKDIAELSGDVKRVLGRVLING